MNNESDCDDDRGLLFLLALYLLTSYMGEFILTFLSLGVGCFDDMRASFKKFYHERVSPFTNH